MEVNKCYTKSIPDDSDKVCRIELTLEETQAILNSLGRTMCNGNALTISMKLEDELVEIIKQVRKDKENLK